MSKIVTAINAMISNPELITEVKIGMHKDECFFKYNNKYTWSLISDSSNFYLHYYTNNEDIGYMSQVPSEVWDDENIHSICYSSKELGTKEALESFKELNTILREKLYGMDQILDEIINTGEF